MKFIALTLSCLILVNAIQENQFQNNFLGDELDEILKNSKLGRAIMKLTQLKSSIKQVDFSRLFVALDDLNAEVRERETEEAASLEVDYQQFLSDSDFYSNQVTEFQNQVAQHQVDVDGLLESRGEFQSSLFAKNQQLADTRGQLSRLEAAMAKSEKIFNGSTGEYDKAIQIVDKASEQLSQVRASSFAEISREEVNTMATVIQRTFGQMTAKVIFYEPLVDAFVQISQAKFSDQEAVQKVMKLLQKLRAELVASKNALNGVYQSEKSDNEALVAQYNQLINNLSLEVVPELQTDIETKNGQIQTKQSLLKDAQDNLNTAQENLDFTNARWVARQAQNRALVQEFNNESQAIAAAIAALERGGIRRP